MATKATGLKKPDDGATGDPKPRAKKTTTDQIIAQSAAQNGKCYVLGTPLGPGSAMVDGKLIGKVANEARGGRSLADFRAKLDYDLRKAGELVKTFCGLFDGKTGVTFAGERKDTTKGAESSSADGGETGKPAAEATT